LTEEAKDVTCITARRMHRGYGDGGFRGRRLMVRDYIMMAMFLLAASFVVHRLLKRHWNAKH
jgi:hypothetical protein